MPSLLRCSALKYLGVALAFSLYMTPCLGKARTGVSNNQRQQKKDKRHYKAACAAMAAKYDRDAAQPERDHTLKELVSDPEAYFAKIATRFEQQKALTPNDPYQFDFSDYGMRVIKRMKTQLMRQVFMMNTSDVSAGRQAHLRAIDKELQALITSQRVTYRQLIELGYFYARAIGENDNDKMGIHDRTMLKFDRLLQGYAQLSYEKEFQIFKDYKNGAPFRILQHKTPVEGFTQAAPRFERDVFDPEKLHMLILPTMEALDESIFMFLLPYPIYFAGITDVAFPADGFMRPGGDFWMHDIRHSTVMYDGIMTYLEKHGLTFENSKPLRWCMAKWLTQLKEALEKRYPKDADNSFRAAQVLIFNRHHDRGYPLLPSSYEDKSESFVPMALYAAYKMSRHNIGFANPQRHFPEIYKWLKNEFWGSRAGEEKMVVRRLQDAAGREGL